MSDPAQPMISIHREHCKKDGLCTRLCPVRIFTMRDGEIPSVDHTEECVLCGQCVAGCPSGAIVHGGFDIARFKRIEERAPVTPEAAYAFIAQRRSVRNYREESPPRELLEKIIGIAGFAPGSPHHRVGWVRHFTVVSGEAQMRQVRDMTVEYLRKLHKLVTGFSIRMAARFDESARAGVAVGPDLAMRLAEHDAGRDAITYHAPAAIFAHAPIGSSTPQVDCDAAMLAIQLLAHANGIGTCWNGLFQGAAAGDHVRGFTKLAELLQIPEGHRCYAAATVGYPAVRLHSVPPREVGINWIGP
jgi:nitroreductase/NAD-dependent dihydropyrimidine dehydrogenase PreA subunit